jgi:hypothetical protein
MKKIFFLALSLSSLSLHAQVSRPLALVYGGDGSCQEDCVTGAVAAAEAAGFGTEVVLPQNYNSTTFKGAVLWIQPGGYSVAQAQSMGSSMMKDVRNFVKNGGGYVGFCAGAFLSTSRIGTSGETGLGLIPGATTLYKALGYPTIEKMTFGSLKKEIYWEGGPYFKLSSSDLKKSEVMGKYSRTNQVGFVRAAYGKGRAYVTGAHPESPTWWKDYAKLIDHDGLDTDVTSEMFLWAAKLK